jgi:hypothetical protein
MESQAQNGSSGKARRKRRKWPWLIAIPLIVIVLILLLVPVYLSSAGFRAKLQTWVDDSTGGTLKIGNLSIGWLRGVRVSKVSFRDASGWASVNVEGIDAQPQLASLLGGTVSLGQTVLDKPQISLDLRKRPAAAVSQSGTSSSSSSPSTSLALLTDMKIRDGSLRLIDTQGQTIELAQVNSTLNVRPAGQTSRVTADMTVTDSGQLGTVRADATVTPAKSAGWTFKGMSGDLVIEVNDLDLGSVAGLLELAGVQVQADGHVSANIQGRLEEGVVQNISATVTGDGLLVTGPLLKGDRLRTSQLAVDTQVKQAGQTLQIDRLQARTDWASLTAWGTVPAKAMSLDELVKSNVPLDVKADLTCDLATLLTQMPGTFDLKQGMQFQTGRATSHISAVKQAGRVALAAHAEISDLAGELDGKRLALSAPVIANANLLADATTTQIEGIDLSASFGKITASGSFEQVNYDGRIDLAKLQAEFGQFVNLGSYRLAGQAASNGQVSIAENLIAAKGQVSVNQFVLAAADGNSISEPAAQLQFSASLDRSKQVLAVENTQLKGSFGTVDVTDATIPFQAGDIAATKVAVAIHQLNLQQVRSYAAALGFFPKNLDLSGMAESRLSVTGQKEVYQIQSQSTQIQNLRLVAAGKEPFEQEQVTVTFDVQVDSPERTINVERFTLDSPQIKIRKGQFNRTIQGQTAKFQALLEGQCDWAAVGKAASVFLPEGLTLKGQRDFSVDLASTYPTAKPDLLAGSLNGALSTGLDEAEYMGLDVGAMNIDVKIANGLLTIAPIHTTANKGQLNFMGQTNLAENPRFLRIDQPLTLAKGVQINTEMTEKMLKNVNPIFADVGAVSGAANFDCRKLAIPLASGMGDRAEVIGVFSADDVMLESSGLLNQILTALQQSRGQELTIHPTNITMKDGVVRYDNMQVDVGDNPVNFGGAIGPKGKLDMTVTLPWTLRGRTERVGREGQGGPRISVPLTGTVDKPELDLSRFLQQQLLKGLEGLF